MMHLFTDRRSFRQIGGCSHRGVTHTIYDDATDPSPWSRKMNAIEANKRLYVACTCGHYVRTWRYPAHQLLSGVRACGSELQGNLSQLCKTSLARSCSYLRQVWASIRFWLEGPR